VARLVSQIRKGDRYSQSSGRVKSIKKCIIQEFCPMH
jgi:hypothetical protein